MRENTNRNNYNSYSYNNFEKNLADDYVTPDWFFNYVREKFDVKVDIACDSTNCKIQGSPLNDKGFNALHEDWSKFEGTKYCFPPFSKPYFSQFLNKAHQEWKNGESSVVVAPLKTVSVDYFQSVKAPLIYVIYPRLNFICNGREINNPDSICLLHYDSRIENFVTPNLHFIDLKQIVPTSRHR